MFRKRKLNGELNKPFATFDPNNDEGIPILSPADFLVWEQGRIQ